MFGFFVETLLVYTGFYFCCMKQQIRLLGVDDSPFTFTEKYATVIGVVMRGGEYLECVLRSQVAVDGSDATYVCKEMIENTRHKKQLKSVMRFTTQSWAAASIHLDST